LFSVLGFDRRNGRRRADEAALQELLDKKQKRLPIVKAARTPAGNVINLMDALKASLPRKANPLRSRVRHPRRPSSQSVKPGKRASLGLPPVWAALLG
jgi:non-homologous end joining protein Ku